MRIKVFRAATVALAMAEIRDALGLDALILSTVGADGGVEVTVALESDDEEEGYSPLPGVIAFDEHPLALPAAPPAENRPWSRHALSAPLLAALEQDRPDAVCARLLRFGPLPLDQAAPVMLVGPPGGGKTLSVAKLATRLVLEGRTPLVVTADDQRAGAVEQLAGFTRLLGLTLIAAGRPETLARVLNKHGRNGDPVLIDAPGLDLLEPAQAALHAELLTAAKASPVLVVPAGIDPVEAAETARAHTAHGARHLLPTRLDRRGRLGGVLAAAMAGDLLLTDAGIGPAVANGLETLTPGAIARRLGHDAATTVDPVAPERAAVPNRRDPDRHDPGRPRASVALAAHIAAQSGANRLSIGKALS